MLLAFVVPAALGGCGATSGPPLPHGAAPSGAAQTTATLRIEVPAKAASSARRAAYVSPATQSIAVSFTPVGGGSAMTFNQNLTAGSSGCTASLVSPLICTVTFSVAPGSYTANFTTYDGVLTAGGVPQGNVLSQNQAFATTIVQGANNVVAVTLQGVPTSIAIASVGGTASATGTNAFTIDKCFTTQTFSIVGLDADGNTIVGPGAPVVSLATGSSLFTIAGPTTANPNLFTLTRTGLPVGLTSATATATLTPGSGGPAASSAGLTLGFNASNCGVAAGTVGTGLNAPNDAIADASGTVYIADTGNGRVLKIDTSGTHTVGSGFSQPEALALDGSGNLYVSDNHSGTITKVTPGGVASTLATGFALPTGLAATPSGFVYVADDAANQITLLANGTKSTLPFGFSKLVGVALDASGNVYTSDEINGIQEITNGMQFALASGSQFIVQTSGISVDATGAVYYTDLALAAVYKIAPGSPLPALVANGFNEPTSVSIAPNGDLFVTDTNSGSGTVTRYR